MSKTGPAPKSAETRAIEGGGAGARNPVSHRRNPEVVLLAPRVEKHDTPKPPPDIPKEGQALWTEVMPWLTEVNAVQVIDLAAIKSMCVAYAQMEKARKVLDEHGYFILGSMGQLTASPAVAVYNNASRLFLAYATEFGLTTMARTRLGLMDVQRKSIQQEMDWTLGPSTRRTDG